MRQSKFKSDLLEACLRCYVAVKFDLVLLRLQLRTLGGRMATKDCMSRVIADYNRLCSNKKHKIDAGRRGLIWNLLLRCIVLLNSVLH